MENLKFSIIIPIYNVEKYIDRCIESVVNQTYRNIEVILVDDGSPDKCPQICDEYATKDERIVVVHKENGGLSSARNFGINIATGDYIMFLDSDDSIELTSCEQIATELAQMSDADIVICNTKRIENNEVSIMNRIDRIGKFVSGQDFLEYVLEKKTGFCMLSPNNIYKRLFLVENQLFFKEGILHEDERWTPIVFIAAKSVLNTHVLFYNYYIREGSITTARKVKNSTDLIDTVYYLKEQYDQVNNKKLRNHLYNYLAFLYLHAIYLGDLPKNKKYIDKKLCFSLSKKPKSMARALVFFVSPSLYCCVAKRIMYRR